MKKKILLLTLIIIILTSFTILSNAEELNYESLIENHGSIMLIVDPENGDIIYANKAAVDFYGYKKETLESMKISQLNAMTDEEVAEEMKRAKEQEVNHFDFKHITADGTIKNIEVSSYPIEVGGRSLLFSVINDVTEKIMIENMQYRNRNLIIFAIFIVSLILSYLLYSKKKIINRLHLKQKEVENNEKLRKTYINADPGYTSLKDEKFRYVFANKALCEFIGDTEDNILEKTDFEVLKEEARRIRKIDEEVLKTMNTVESTEELRGQIYKVTKFPVELLNGEYGVGGYVNNITEKEEINRKLKQSRNKLRSILETTQDGFWIVGENQKIIDVNDAYCKMSGYTREEILNSTISDLEFLETPEDTEKRKERIKKTGHDLFDTKHVKKDGEIFDVEVSISLFSKKPLEFICFFRDITQRKEDKQKIINMKERLENIIEGTNVGTWELDIQKDVEIIDEKWAEMLGYKAEEISPVKSETWKEITHPDDLKRVEEETRKLYNKEIKYYDVEFRIRHKNGKWIWVNDRAKITKWSKDGKPLIANGTHTDITEKKKSEESLKKFNNLIEYIIKYNTSGVAVHDKKMNFMYVSEKYYDIFNIKNRNIVGKYHYDVFTDIPEKWKHIHKRSLEGEVISSKEDPYYREDGTMEWTKWKTRPWYEKDGAIGGVITYTEIITEQKESEEKIYNEKEKFKTTLLSVGDAVISTDKEGRIKIMNKVAEELTGWTQKEVYNKPLEKVLNIINEYSREIYENPAKKALELGKIVEMSNHTILINKDGSEIPIQDSAAPIKDKKGNITGAVIVFRDFTEKREKQKEIEYLSFNDYLTGLYNRRYMQDSIKRLDTKRNIPFSIIVIDVNGLKLTNDAYGHDMGDKLLKQVAEILKKSCREDDIICRVGGDEFVVLLPGTNSKEAEEIKNRIINESHKASLDSVIISLALGYATKKREDKDILEIYKEADNNMYKNKLKYGKIMRNKTIETVLININNKYDHEQIHTQRVSQYCESIARAINLSSKEIEDAKIAGTLHDIGKIIVPPEILGKEEKFTQEEWETIKKHPITGYQLLKSVDEYSHLAEAVLHHHEKLDASGYPEGLSEDEIPLLSKIIAVADAYEAMTASRPYQKKKTKKEALKELKKYSGTQFDENIVKIFINEVL